MSNLSFVDLSHNQLTGAIPDEISGIRNLEVLNLGHNEMTGDVPSTLGSISQGECLALLFLLHKSVAAREAKSLIELGC